MYECHSFIFHNIAFVADELSLLDSADPILGSIGIIGLYITILITVGGVIRNFLLPQVTDLLYLLYFLIIPSYSEIADSRLLLSLIHSIYICRYSNYRNHFKDEKRIYELLIRVFRSSDLFVKLTEELPNHKSVRNVICEEF